MKYLSRIIGIVSAVSMLVLAPAASASVQPSLYFAQSDLTGAQNSNVSLPVRIDAAGKPLDAVQVNVSFPADKLSFVGLNASGSPFGAFIPASPTAVNGHLTVNAAHLSKQPITGNALVAKLVFAVKSPDGLATVSLAGSRAYRDGNRVGGLSVGTATIHTLAASAHGTASQLHLSQVGVSNVTVNNATVHWRTNAPSDSLVDFGQTKYYGMTAGSSVLTTDHTVYLGAVLAGGSLVHFKVASVASDGNLQTSGDQTFKTRGYTVAIKVTDNSGKVLPGATVELGGAKVIANVNAVAVVPNVAAGTQRVNINGGKSQYILVKYAVGPQAAITQDFSLQAKPARITPLWYVLSAALLILLLLFSFVRRKTSARNKSA